jgi:hypothetical protein
VRDRTFPDPNDEARGHGSMIRPRLVVIARTCRAGCGSPRAGALAASGLLAGVVVWRRRRRV